MERNNFTFADLTLDERLKGVDHILIKIEKLIDWSRIEKILSKTDYREISSTGRDSYSPMTMFRILLVQRIHNLSDRDIEDYIRFHIIFMRFCGLSFDSPIPDHTTICRWRERFRQFKINEQVFAEINKQLEAKGLELRNATIIDATLIESQSRPRKQVIIDVEPVGDDELHEATNSFSGIEQIQDTHYKITVNKEESKDKDARWIKKGKKSVYGYKGHLAVNKKGLITGVITTSANVYDGHMLGAVISKANPAEKSELYGDKGYDWETNREIIKTKNLVDKIMRKKKRNAPSNEADIIRNKLISKVRYVVERTIGGLKNKFRIGRSRYIGQEKTHEFNLLSAIGYNMIRSVNLLLL
jgi:IS5 family transposase